MFTGIIKNSGCVLSVAKSDSTLSLKVAVTYPEDLCIGDSVAINGVCLTVVEIDENVLSFDVINETVTCTNLGDLTVNEEVNTEFCLRLNDFVGGHLVTGHVDFVSKIIDVANNTYWFSLEGEYYKYLAKKGSICINGVSLTVNEVETDRFRVDLIPETLNSTNLFVLKVGSKVNIEIDLIARYIEKFI